MTNQEMIEECRAYIERHSNEEVTAAALADRCGYSLYYFCHIFKACCGCSVGEYLRRCRLENARRAIRGGSSITRAGFDSGFGSSAGFAKAFRREYGLSAREYKRQITKGKGECAGMKPEMIKKEAMTVWGYEIAGEYDKDYEKAGAYWKNVDFKKYPPYPAGVNDLGEVALWMQPDEVSGEFKYFFGFLTDSEVNAEGFSSVTIPAAEYAVFQAEKGDVAAEVKKLWKYIFGEWADGQSEYKVSGDGMCFEFYEGEEAYIYIPVIPA